MVLLKMAVFPHCLIMRMTILFLCADVGRPYLAGCAQPQLFRFEAGQRCLLSRADEHLERSRPEVFRYCQREGSWYPLLCKCDYFLLCRLHGSHLRAEGFVLVTKKSSKRSRPAALAVERKIRKQPSRAARVCSLIWFMPVCID